MTENANVRTTQQFSIPNLTNFVSVKLNGDNYLSWKHQMLMVLKTLGLQKHIDANSSPPTTPPDVVETWSKADCFVSACINSTLDPSVAHLAIDTESAADLWKAIEESYLQQAFAKKSQLKTQFQTIKQGTNSITVYCDSIKKICDSLRSIGEKVTEPDLVLQTLHGLNSTYNMFVLNIENSETTPTFLQLRSRLLLYEERMLQQSEGVPISAMTALKINQPPHLMTKDNNMSCQICHKQGHTADRCFFRYESSGGNQNVRGRGRNGSGNWRGNGRGANSRGFGRGVFSRGAGRGFARGWTNLNSNFNFASDGGKTGYICTTDSGL